MELMQIELTTKTLKKTLSCSNRKTWYKYQRTKLQYYLYQSRWQQINFEVLMLDDCVISLLE